MHRSLRDCVKSGYYSPLVNPGGIPSGATISIVTKLSYKQWYILQGKKGPTKSVLDSITIELGIMTAFYIKHKKTKYVKYTVIFF